MMAAHRCQSRSSWISPSEFAGYCLNANQLPTIEAAINVLGGAINGFGWRQVAEAILSGSISAPAENGFVR
jgi:hypothetical protein